MLRILILVLFPRLFVTMSLDVTSYAKVSKNGQLARSSHDSLSWIARAQERNDTNTNAYDEGRSVSEVVLTVSPIYVTPRISKLKKGEAIDHPKYSTLDHEMIAQLDTGRKPIQQRFNPPATFEHDAAFVNKRPQKGASMSNSDNSDVNSSTFLGPIYPSMYEYSPPEFIDDKPTSKPTINIQKYPPLPIDDEMSNSYELPPSNYHASDQQEMDYSNFDVPPSYENDGSMKKPMKIANHNNRPFSLAEHDPYEHDFHHHEVIYDHLPEYHEHTTEEPEMNDQRLDKRPYSYYFIGKKLWYVPLYFSIYFIIYVAALVLKSIARHKINFPAHLAEVTNHARRNEPNEGWWDFAERILEGVERFAETSGKDS